MSDRYLAKYLRISEDDEDIGEDKKESNSIINQRKLLNSYIEHHEELSKYPAKEFVDEGISGVNFHRPGVQRLLKEVREGKIFCIVVKDLSRFGRNYIEVGDYIEQIFPFLDVRFIAVSDYFDSSQNVAGLDMGFKNLIHDLYSRDLSRKVKSAVAIMQKRGMYNGGGVPFGYKLSDEADVPFVPDQEAAEIVKKIFALADSGNTTTKIAGILNEEGVPTPGVYKKQHMGIHYKIKNEKRALWTASSINSIIRNEVYRGTYVGNKSSTVKPGVVKSNDKSEYIKLENHHERLIEEDLFREAQKIIVSRPRKTSKSNKKTEQMFTLRGKVKCGCCGYNMNINRVAKVPYYYCRMGNGCGSYTKIKTELLEKTVWDVLQKLMKVYQEREKLQQNERAQVLSAIAKAQKEKRSLEIKLEHCKVSRLELYHQWKEELLIKEEYIVRKEELIIREVEYREKLELLNQCLAENISVQEKADQKRGLAVLAEAKGLTKGLVEELIERVEIYGDGRIQIKWRFSDGFSVRTEKVVDKDAEK